jgi:hypothetical protein
MEPPSFFWSIRSAIVQPQQLQTYVLLIIMANATDSGALYEFAIKALDSFSKKQ